MGIGRNEMGIPYFWYFLVGMVIPMWLGMPIPYGMAIPLVFYELKIGMMIPFQPSFHPTKHIICVLECFNLRIWRLRVGTMPLRVVVNIS